MYLPPNAVINIQSLSKAIVERTVTEALAEFKTQGTIYNCQTGMEQKMNGKVKFTPNPKDIEDIKKFMINEGNAREREYLKMQKVSQPEVINDLSASQDDRILQTIQEENKNSSDDSSSVTSESDTSESDTSDPNITTFIVDTTPKSPEEYTNLLYKLSSNNEPKDVIENGKLSKQEDKVMARLGKQVHHGGVKAHSFNNELNDATKLNSFDEPLSSNHLPMLRNGLLGNSSGSSDVVFGDIKNKRVVNDTDTDSKELNNSGMVSGGSDSKDHNDMLAELQKIVQEDEQLQQSSIRETYFTTSPSLPSAQDSDKGGVTKDSQNTSNVLEDSVGNNDSIISSHGNSITIGNSGSDIGEHLDDDNSHDNSYHGDSHGSSSHFKTTNQEQQPQGPEDSYNILNESQRLSKSQTITDKESTSLNNKESFENIENKLLELGKSNTEQTAKIKQLKDVNDSLKTKFDELEKTSGHHHCIEDQILKKNEELEKHLLGVLKSQEMIFDMREKMHVVTAANEKLTKDYQEAVKALEAVDKLFGQKDDLVRKWKDSTEESRRLVELLKKHNAEVADLESVDKLKEEIAKLQTQILKAEETNKGNDKTNEELVKQYKIWKTKFEFENEQVIKLNYELQEVKKELRNHQKLASKRGRKNQILHLEMTELKDMLKLAKEKMTKNEIRLKEFEQKYSGSQEMYTSIIHEKEKQHSVLIKNSETYQKDLLANAQMAEALRKEIGSLKTSCDGLEKEKTEKGDELTNSQKNLEESLVKQAEINTNLQQTQSELEQCKIEKVDNELYTEEQTVRLQELEEQCRGLQDVVRQFGYRATNKPKRHRSHGQKLRLSHSMPTYPNLDMYRKLLAPPKTMRSRPHTSLGKRQPTNFDEENVEDNIDERGQPLLTSTAHTSSQMSRPKSTYGNRQLSSSHKPEHDQTENNRDWVPKIVLVDSKKLEVGSEYDSGSISADQFAMEYVKVGDKVLIEIPVEGRNQNLPGVVKYVGPVYHNNFKTGIYAGLKLEIPVGDTNGTLGGRVYFRSLKKHGKFIQLSHILAIQNQRTQQYTRILPLAYK